MNDNGDLYEWLVYIYLYRCCQKNNLRMEEVGGIWKRFRMRKGTMCFMSLGGWGRRWGSSWDMLKYVSKQGLWKFWKTLKQVAWKMIWESSFWEKDVIFPCLSKPRNFLELSTFFTPEVQQPQFLDGQCVLLFFPRGKQCPKHWQADRFKGIVQKLWVGSDWPFLGTARFLRQRHLKRL